METALRINYRFTLSSGEFVFDIATLRRRGLVLRFVRVNDISVDERMLSSAFPLVRAPSGVAATIVIAGAVEADEVGVVRPGEAVLLDLQSVGQTRSTNAVHLNLEWSADYVSAEDVGTPRRLGTPDLDLATKIGEAILDRNSDQEAVLEEAFELFRSIGAPSSAAGESYAVPPTDRDRDFARAFEAQHDNLFNDRHMSLPRGESIGVSDRQFQRGFEEFCVRYEINARGWRDVRNRWRVQNAALLLSRRSLTVAEVAREVGYASPNALSRAFSLAGFPPPAILRQRMSEMDPLR